MHNHHVVIRITEKAGLLCVQAMELATGILHLQDKDPTLTLFKSGFR